MEFSRQLDVQRIEQLVSRALDANKNSLDTLSTDLQSTATDVIRVKLNETVSQVRGSSSGGNARENSQATGAGHSRWTNPTSLTSLCRLRVQGVWLRLFW